MELPTAGYLNILLKAWLTDLSAEFCQYILYCATKGLKDLHEKNFVHRKVGPESIACNIDGSIKLADLDQVRKVQTDEQYM